MANVVIKHSFANTYMYTVHVYQSVIPEASTEIISDNIVRGMANISCHDMISYFPNY